MRVTPLNCGRKWYHQCKSDLSSEVKGQKRVDRLARKVFNRPDMKIRAGRTQAVTKDMTPSKDCRSRRDTTSAVSSKLQRESRSRRRSGVMDIVISTVLKWTPKKTIQVEGAQSFSGEDSKPSVERSSSRVSKAIVALCGDSAPPKSSI